MLAFAVLMKQYKESFSTTTKTRDMKKEIQTPEYQNLYKDYETFIKAKNYKAGKNKVFQTPVKQFIIWLETHGISTIKQVTTKEMMAYYEYLIERPNQTREGTLADSTINNHLFSISMFVDNLLIKEEIKKAFLIPKHGSRNKQARNYLIIEEIKILYQHTENPLEKALLATAYGCGLRRSEIENLNTCDMQFSDGMLIVQKGKGDKRRTVPMSDSVLKDLKAYMTEYRHERLTGKQQVQAFFVTKRGSRMSGKALAKVLAKLIARTHNQAILSKEISLHCLRHSIANHLAENNAGIDFIRGFLGHSQINTSYIYAIKNKKRLKTFKT